MSRGAARVVDRVEALATPTAADLVGNYIRGKLLYGSPGALADFRWRTYPVRAVITAQTAKVPRATRAVMRRGDFEVLFDHDLDAVIEGCRANRADPWLTDDVAALFRHLNAIGLVSTVAVYSDGELVGGSLCIQVGRTLSGQTTFSFRSNAGNVALAAVCDELGDDRRWSTLDVGLQTERFARFGAREVSVQELSEIVLRGLAPVTSSAPAVVPGEDARARG